MVSLGIVKDRTTNSVCLLPQVVRVELVQLQLRWPLQLIHLWHSQTSDQGETSIWSMIKNLGIASKCIDKTCYRTKCLQLRVFWVMAAFQSIWSSKALTSWSKSASLVMRDSRLIQPSKIPRTWCHFFRQMCTQTRASCLQSTFKGTQLFRVRKLLNLKWINANFLVHSRKKRVRI